MRRPCSEDAFDSRASPSRTLARPSLFGGPRRPTAQRLRPERLKAYCRLGAQRHELAHASHGAPDRGQNVGALAEADWNTLRRPLDRVDQSAASS